MSDLSQKNASSFGFLFRELHTRFVSPVGQVTFWVYLLVGIVLAGGIPIWFEVYRLSRGMNLDDGNLYTAMNCYVPAIGCAAAVQLMMFAVDNKQKYLMSFSLFAGVLFAVVSILTLSANQKTTSCGGWLLGVVICILAVLMWWIANGLDPTFQDRVDFDASVGGPADAPLEGNTTGYTT